MTYLEKFRQKHPDNHQSDRAIFLGTCPIEMDRCPDELLNKPIPVGCPACWNREIPEEADA